MKLIPIVLLFTAQIAGAATMECKSNVSEFRVVLDAQTGVADIYSSEKIAGKMKCTPQKPTTHGNDVPYVSYVCDDFHGQDAGFSGRIVTGGFTGMSDMSLNHNVTLVAQLPCSRPK